MALPASDSFTNSDGTQLAAHSANWTLENGTLTIYSNALQSNNNSYTNSCGRWNADTFGNDQYSKATLQYNASDGSVYCGVAVRIQSGAATGYVAYTNGSSLVLKRISGGSSAATLGSTSVSISTNDVLELQAVGNDLEVFINDVSTLGPITDTNHPSGYAGVSGQQNGSNMRLLDWEGGNIAGGGFDQAATIGTVAITGGVGTLININPGLSIGVMGTVAITGNTATLIISLTDTFDNSDGVTLEAHNSAWTQDTGDYRIISNRIRNYYDSYAEAWARYTGITPDDTQFSEAVMKTADSDGTVYGGIAVRMDNLGNGYGLITNRSTILFLKYTAFSGANLASPVSQTVSTNDVLRIEAEDDNIRGYLNDVLITGFDVTDSTFASGDVGIVAQQDGSQADLETWNGGTLTFPDRVQLTGTLGTVAVSGLAPTTTAAIEFIAQMGAIAINGLTATITANAPYEPSTGEIQITGLIAELITLDITEYFISPTGDDANSGLSASLPVKTFAQAVSLMSAGDYLTLLDGNYGVSEGTGGIHWDTTTYPNSAQIPSGVDRLQPTVVRAQNRAQAIISIGLFVGRTARKDSHIKFDGIIARGFHLFNSSYNYLKNCGFTSSVACGTGDHGNGNTYNLIEDCWIDATDKRIIALNYRADYNTWRRVVVRGNGCDLAECIGSGNPNVGITVYDSISCDLQNTFVVDRELSLGSGYADFATAQHTSGTYQLTDNEWYGCASVNSVDHGFNFEADSVVLGAATWTVKHCAVFNGEHTGFNLGLPYNGKTANVYENLTVMLSPTSTGDAVRMAPGQNTSTLQNVAAQYGARSINSASASNNMAIYDVTLDYNQASCSADCYQDPELFDTSLPHPIYVASGSYLEGKGQGGGNIGASIYYRYGTDGTIYGDTGHRALTSIELWPYPNEDIIKTEFAKVSTRGFCGGTSIDGSAQTLTRYIWEINNTQIPASVYAVSATVDIQGTSGTVDITGQTSVLVAGFIGTAAQGTIAVNGETPVLFIGVIQAGLTAQQGTIAVNGNVATLINVVDYLDRIVEGVEYRAKPDRLHYRKDKRMTHQAPQIYTKPVGSERTLSFALDESLDSAELLTGTPTIEEVGTSDLTITYKRVSVSDLTIDDVLVLTGQAMQCLVTGGVANTSYTIKWTCYSDSIPAQKFVVTSRLDVIAD